VSPRNNPSRAQVARTREEQRVIATRLTVSSALPPPSDLERYTALMPDMPERLVKRWELQGDHRMSIERRWVTAQIVRGYITTAGGWIIIMTLMIGSLLLIANGHEGLGAAGIILDLAILAGSFIGRWLGGPKNSSS
jgi:uncharacterized membrane protein